MKQVLRKSAFLVLVVSTSLVLSGCGSTNTTTTSSEKSTTQQVESSGVVKKSTSGICHAPGTTYYDRTLNYKSFNSLDDCIASGGRLPAK